MNKQEGFTLIEISIVLVIIGLILGAVSLRSGSVIGGAKTADTVALIKDLSAAINDFRSRYHYLPGDMPKASDDISGIVSGSTCDLITATASIGNGQIDTNGEIGCVAEHLVQAGLIKGEKRGSATLNGIYTKNNMGSASDVSVLARSQGKIQTTTYPFSATIQNVIEISGLPCETAMGLDSKMDDGNFATGNIRASVSTCTPGGTNDPVPYLDIAL